MPDGVRTRVLPRAVLASAAVLLAGCASASTEPQAQELAQRFSQEVNSGTLWRGMTPELAENLYGTNGGVVCAALDGTPGDVVLGWPRARVAQLPASTVPNLLAYDRAVVQVYCPDRLPALDELFADLGTRS